jgi:outer membrane protein OmpU
MNNLKKIGLSALAGSLVAFSANAGEVTVNGSAGMYLEHINGGAANSGKSFSMDNQLTFTGGGELDNGLNVSISFVIDQGDDTTSQVDATNTFGGNAPFDSHSVTVSSDSLGSLTMHGEGMDSAAGAVDGTVAGNIWDAFQAAADEPEAAPGASGGLTYKLPSVIDGVAIAATYTPKGTGAASSTSASISYTGVEGLSLTYAWGDDNSVASSNAEQTVLKATYAYGPITVGYMTSEYDDVVAAGDQETTSYSIAYTVSDNLSVSYGTEELTFGTVSSTNVAADFARVKVAYTAGGMTLSASSATGDNVSYSTTITEDREVWALGASFAF